MPHHIWVTKTGGVAEWLRRSVSNLVGSTHVCLNPVADTTNLKPAANSAVHPSVDCTQANPSEVDKGVLRGNSEGTSRSVGAV